MDRISKLLLAGVLLALAANLAMGTLTLGPDDARASESTAQDMGFGHQQGGAAVFMSADGKIVFATDCKAVYRSRDYGNPGSWEMVLK